MAAIEQPRHADLSLVRELDQLVALLPTPEEETPIAQGDIGVGYLKTRNPRYVPPPLLEVEGSDERPAVVLISAPAAVGKTAMARELGVCTNLTYWDLGRFKVADNFLAGTIGRVFGYENTGAFLKGLADGSNGLILDALDEASVGSGNMANFEAFLRGTGQLIAECDPPGLVVAMFARDETAFFVREFLREGGARVLHLRIDYFDHKRSRKFLDQALDDLDDVSRNKSPNRYEEAVLVIFATLGKLLGTPEDPWADDSRSFTGYAPVLAAIADYLHTVENGDYRAALDELMANTSLWSFLERIVLGVLEREQDKLLTTARNQLGLAFERDAYTPEDQLHLLMEPNLQGVFIKPPSDLRKEDYGAFIDAARQQFEEHPFLARRNNSPALRFSSPAFRDYVLAAALASGDRSVVDLALVGTRLAEFQPSPLLAFFLLLRLEEKKRALRAETFSAFYESLISRNEGLRLDLTDEPENHDVALATIRRGMDAHVPSVPGAPKGLGEDVVTQVRILEISSTPLTFRTRVRDVIMDHAHAAVVLGESNASVKIGPNVDITAEIIRIEAADVGFSTRHGSVALVCNTFEDRSGGGAPKVFDSDAGIVIAAPRVRFPWDRFAPRSGDSRESRALAHAFDELWQLVKWFKSGISGGITYHRRTLELIVKRHKGSEAFLQYAKQTELITPRGEYYVLHPGVAHVSLEQIKQRELTPELAIYLRRYIEQRSSRTVR